MNSRAQFGAALALDVLGGGAALLISTRTWQSILFRRPRPLADEVLHVSGRTVSSAPTAFGLVALAGIVAVLATRGLARRMVGAVLMLAGGGLAWFSLAGLHRVSASRAASLFESKHRVGVAAGPGTQVSVTASWGVLSAIAGLLVLAAGLVILARGHRWAGMSVRYDAPRAGTAGDEDRTPAGTHATATGTDATATATDVTATGSDRTDVMPAGTDHASVRAAGRLWSALDRGDDPTAGDRAES